VSEFVDFGLFRDWDCGFAFRKSMNISPRSVFAFCRYRDLYYQFLLSCPRPYSLSILSRDFRRACPDLNLHKVVRRHSKLFSFCPTCLIHLSARAVRWQSRHVKRAVAYVTSDVNEGWTTSSVGFYVWVMNKPHNFVGKILGQSVGHH